MVNLMEDLTSDVYTRGGYQCPGCGGHIASQIIVRTLARYDDLVLTGHSCGFGNLSTSTFGMGGGTNFGMDWADVMGFIESLKIQGLIPGKRLVAIRGEGRAIDMGMGTMVHAFLRGGPFTAIIMNNESWATAGSHATSMSPLHANDKSLLTGKDYPMLPVALIMKLCGAKYTATATYGYPEDLVAKVEMALANQPSYLEVLHSCEMGWHYPVEMSVELSRLAVRTGMYPLFEWLSDGGKNVFHRTVRVSEEDRTPVIDYLKYQRRFAHVSESDVADLGAFINQREGLLDQLEAGFK